MTIECLIPNDKYMNSFHEGESLKLTQPSEQNKLYSTKRIQQQKNYDKNDRFKYYFTSRTWYRKCSRH